MNLYLSSFIAIGALAACNAQNAGDATAADPSTAAGPAQTGQLAVAEGEGPYAKPGFVTEIDDGRLWVFAAESGMQKSDKHITFVGAGPGGMTVKALDRRTAQAYLASRPGFEIEIEDGRIWVWRAGEEHGRSDKHATLIGVGPGGMTVKGIDYDTALAYVATVPGFVVEIEDGRIWVWRVGETRERSEKHVTRVAAGPLGKTLKALDRATLDAYLAALSA